PRSSTAAPRSRTAARSAAWRTTPRISARTVSKSASEAASILRLAALEPGEKAGEVAAELRHLGRRDGLDVRLAGMERGVVLVVGLGLVELAQRLERGGDRAVEDARALELLDVGLGHPALLLAGIEDRR